jgi:hypothetical protein
LAATTATTATGTTTAATGAPDPVDPRCALPATSTELVRDGEAILLRWDLPAGDT